MVITNVRPQEIRFFYQIILTSIHNPTGFPSAIGEFKEFAL